MCALCGSLLHSSNTSHLTLGDPVFIDNTRSTCIRENKRQPESNSAAMRAQDRRRDLKESGSSLRQGG